jgi:hypothetical protein
MSKLLFSCFLIPLFCLCQKTERLEFSISDIDSLSNKETCFKISDYASQIHVEKTFSDSDTKVVGNGYDNWNINAYFIDSLNYKGLSREDKKKYNDKNTCLIIRADYVRNITYDDQTVEKESIFFYFNHNTIFYIKYKKDNYNINFYFSDINKMLLDNRDLKEYLMDKSNEIQKIWDSR